MVLGLVPPHLWWWFGCGDTGWRAALLLASQFVCLQQVGVTSRGIVSLPKADLEIHTPIRVEQWAVHLQDHPNRPWVENVLLGLQEGV